MTRITWLFLAAFLFITTMTARAQNAPGPIFSDGTMSGEQYRQAIAAGYWIIGPEIVPGPNGKWVSCYDISEATGFAGVGAGDPTTAEVVIVNIGRGQWAWDDGSGNNPCLPLHRTLPNAAAPTPPTPRTPSTKSSGASSSGSNVDDPSDPMNDLRRTGR